jgi:hypothetical protein
MNAIDATKIISSRKQIATAGAYNLKVTSVGMTKDGSKFIANLNGMTPYHYEQAMNLFDEGTEESLQLATNQHLTASLRLTDYLPTKGEVVKVVVEEITTNNGITGLFVTSLSELKASATKSVDFASMLSARTVVLEQDPTVVI